MSRRIGLSLLMPATILLLNALASAQTTSDTFRAGLKSFTIPSPSPDLVEPGYDYRVLLEPLVSNTNRLVAGFITSDELKALLTTTGTPLTRYALVEVPRRAEFADVSPDAFKQVTDSMAAQFRVPVDDTLKDQQDEINRRIKDPLTGAPSKTVVLDKPVLLGALFTKPDAASYGMVMPVTIDGVTKRVAVSTVVVRVQQRLLFLYVYEAYKDESSVQWVRTTGEHWADAILQANR